MISNVDAVGHGNGLQADFQIDLFGRHLLTNSDFFLQLIGLPTPMRARVSFYLLDVVSIGE